LYIKYIFVDDYFLRRRLGRAEYLAHTGKTIGAYEALVVNPERRRLLRKRMGRCEDNIKIDLQEKEWVA
jgi:hypothetical protein